MIKFEDLKQSAVVFNEDAHTYRRGDEELSGITGLIHSVLQLGVYPEANEFVKQVQIPKAGHYGTCVHKAIQTFDTIGIEATQFPEVVHHTRDYGDVLFPAHDVSYELHLYRTHKLTKCRTLASEFTVSLGRYASQIDSTWVDDDDNIYLVDFKTNNLDYYPGGKAGLMEYLSWQLSCYAVMFELQTGLKVKGLYGLWIRKEDCERWEIARIPDEQVLKLLETELVINPDGYPHFLYINEGMQVYNTKADVVEAPTKGLVVPQEITTAIANLVKAEKLAKDMKEKLRELMEKNNVTKWECDAFTATIGKDSVAKNFDSKALEADDPKTYAKYVKTVKRKGSFTIKAK